MRDDQFSKLIKALNILVGLDDLSEVTHAPGPLEKIAMELESISFDIERIATALEDRKDEIEEVERKA